MYERKPTLKLENTQLIFRNFSGKESEYNRSGERSTGVVVPPEKLEEAINGGWNVKELPPRDPQDQPLYYINAKVRFDNFPPTIYLVLPDHKPVKLENAEDTNQIDHTEICNVDAILSPYDWSVRGQSGRTAYIKTLYVNVIEDDFAEKYRMGDDGE